ALVAEVVTNEVAAREVMGDGPESLTPPFPGLLGAIPSTSASRLFRSTSRRKVMWPAELHSSPTCRGEAAYVIRTGTGAHGHRILEDILGPDLDGARQGQPGHPRRRLPEPGPDPLHFLSFTGFAGGATS